ncbi:RluA family pseudouridine synthase [Catenovulum sediminis]|uniref:RluA family pseudouridine synthase n=1 Tax=Catenovulum sediminis TaxID=1740262 RepID=UPI00117D9756|nr:pseudouridine synthase [Catenovulum sediminis]
MQKFIYTPPAGIPEILHQDKDIIIINKPSGLLSNPGRAEETHDCALSRLQSICPHTILVHRLDCETSGIMVFAKNKKAEVSLKKQFEARQTHKVYIAEINGIPNTNSGTISWPLIADKSNVPLQKVDLENGKPASTDYRLLINKARSSIIELTPKTGRTHQLRVHMHHWGHTILGDNFYGEDIIRQSASRLRLHALSLAFTHPYTAKLCSFYAPAEFI